MIIPTLWNLHNMKKSSNFVENIFHVQTINKRNRLNYTNYIK